MVGVWDFTSFWQFDIFFLAQCLIIMHLLNRYNNNIKHTRMTSLTSFLRGRYLPSLLRPMLPSVVGFAISSDGYFLCLHKASRCTKSSVQQRDLTILELASDFLFGPAITVFCQVLAIATTFQDFTLTVKLYPSKSTFGTRNLFSVSYRQKKKFCWYCTACDCCLIRQNLQCAL